jgi:Ca2+-binding EF-hand superfamily protein
VTKADLRRFILLTDANKDGRVDFKEFYNVLSKSDNMDESDLEEAGVFI